LDVQRTQFTTSLIDQSNADKYITKTIIQYIRYNGKDSLHYLFRLPPIINRKTISNYNYLTDFLHKEIAEMYSPRQKRKIMKHFVKTYFGEKEVTSEDKIAVIESLIIPLLNECFK
jgi:hypothetical protein